MIDPLKKLKLALQIYADVLQWHFPEDYLKKMKSNCSSSLWVSLFFSTTPSLVSID